MQLTENAREKWVTFLNNQENVGHVNRTLSGADVDEHVRACMDSAEAMVNRVKLDTQGFQPSCILEVGCSTGLNCLALQAGFPKAKVIGIEPELEAITAAMAMPVGSGMSPKFIQGVGEDVKLEDESVDLIICHTVIEHVRDVDQVIREFSRLLTKNGVVHLDAPNYIWPFEPHLHIWTVPMLGKRFVKFTAQVQGKGEMQGFLGHLQFVTPYKLERLFRENGLTWENRAEKKLIAAVGGTADIKKYRFASKILAFLGNVGVAKFLVAILVRVGLYPSVMYTLRKL